MLRELQNNIKHNDIHIIVIPEGEEEQGMENLSEKVMMENFPDLITEKITQIQETESPNQEEPKEAHFKTHHHSSDKIPRQSENLEGSKEKQEVTYKGAPIRLGTDFSMETLQTTRE